MLKNENQSYDVDTIIFSGRENELRKVNVYSHITSELWTSIKNVAKTQTQAL